MCHRPDRASLLPRTPSLDCLETCLAAHRAYSRNTPAEADASVQIYVDKFVRGSSQESLDCGARLLRRVIETGIRNPPAATSIWFAAQGRLRQQSMEFLAARSIADFRAQRTGSIDRMLQGVTDEMTQIYPELAEDIAYAHARMGGLLRSIDLAGYEACCLATLHNRQELAALCHLVREPLYTVALDCVQTGIGIAQERGLAASAAMEDDPSSAVSMRVVQLLGCEDVWVRMVLWDEPKLDEGDTRLLYRLQYASEIGRQLDRGMSPEALAVVAALLEKPAVQAAFATARQALPEQGEQKSKLLLKALAARIGEVDVAGRCL